MTAAATTDVVKAQSQEVATPVAQATPQFFRGFEGAAVEPFPELARKVLAEAVNPRDVEIKPDGIVFLPGVAWRRILTRAFGAGGWAIVPRTPARVMGNLVIYHGALVALGRFVSEAVGECFYREGNANMSYASCIEGARTDCIGRCARDLGYAAELWDANWREEWKKKYAVSYRGKKWDGKKQAEVETTLWRLKDRVSNPHDLMAGAGGVAPAATAAASDESRSSAPTPAGGSPVEAPASSQPKTNSTASATPDTGEAASPAQLDAIRGEFTRLKFTIKYLKVWFEERFGLTTPATGKEAGARLVGSLTTQQADTAMALLSAFGTNVYPTVLAGLQERGACR